MASRSKSTVPGLLALAAGLALTLLPGCGRLPAVKESDVVDRHGNVEGLERLDLFADRAASGQASSVRLVRYTVEGDPIFYSLTAKKSGGIELRRDTRRDAFGEPKVTSYACAKLERMESEAGAETDAAGGGGQQEVRYVLKGCSGVNGEWELLTTTKIE